MNKLTKVGLTALASTLVAGSVSAAEMSASGSAAMTFTGGDEKSNQGNGWTMADSVTFSASGDVNDIGVTLTLELDGDGADGTNQLDNQSIAFDLGDMGSLTFAGHGGSSAMSAKDDVMPTAYEEPWDIVTNAESQVIDGHSGNNMFTYSYSHDSGVTLTAAYLNASAAVNDVSYSDFGIEYTGMEGLTVGYAQGDVEATTNSKSDQSTMYAKYAIGAVTVGVQMSENDSESGQDYETTGFGISYQVNDDLAVSYGSNDMEKVNHADPDQEASAFSLSYTMGSLGISASVFNVDNVANSSTNDRKAYQFGLSFAF